MNPYKKKVLEARKKILQLTIEQEKQINNIYAKSAARLIDEILELPDISRTRVHDIDIARLLNDYTKDLYKQLYPNIKDNIMESSIIQRQVILDYVDQVAKDRKLSEIVKYNINSYSNTVVKNLVAGEYYKDGKTLSKRLWNLTSDNSNKIDEFIKMNIASGANARKLANDLELLINPNNRIVTNNFKAGFNSYKISYQAQRLARTSITHAATETQIQNAKKNPFNKGLRWNLSASHSARMHGKTDICDNYNGQIFKPEETPLQHPNCLCYFTEEVVEVDDAIARINKWVEGNEDKELDEWSTEFNTSDNTDNKPGGELVKVNGKDGTAKVNISRYKYNIRENLYNRDTSKDKDAVSWKTFEFSSKEYKNKKEISKHLKDTFDINFSDSRKYPINKDLLQDSINWLDKFHEYFKGFKKIDPVKLPAIKVKAGIEPVGYYSYYPKRPEAVELVLNGKYFCDKTYNREYIERCIRTQWTVPNARGYKTFVHEYGHHIADSLKWMDNRELDSSKWCKDFINDVLLEYNNIYNKAYSFKDASEFVSRYGGKNPSETFAEAFAEYFGGDNPREFAQIFGMKVENKLKEYIKMKE
ncbi:exonuclease SbcC [Clostridium butyricum]|uniref:exonuclease SbcC n=2 Tax=Clostridium butyricum TaxID=1492 RepID=UPI002ABE4203|nr:exonuclease SbcC [Clostridium butyricum]